MTLAIGDQIAQAILDETTDPANAGRFDAVPEFVAERIHCLELGDRRFPKPLLAIYAADERREPASKDRTEREWEIHIGVVQSLAGETTEEIDPLKRLVEQIADYWELRAPEGLKNPCVAIEVLPILPELVKELKFVGVVALTFKGFKR